MPDSLPICDFDIMFKLNMLKGDMTKFEKEILKINDPSPQLAEFILQLIDLTDEFIDRNIKVALHVSEICDKELKLTTNMRLEILKEMISKY